MDMIKNKKVVYVIGCEKCVNEIQVSEISDIVFKDWVIIPNPPNCKGMDKHHCPRCHDEKTKDMLEKFNLWPTEKQKNFVNEIKEICKTIQKEMR